MKTPRAPSDAHLGVLGAALTAGRDGWSLTREDAAPGRRVRAEFFVVPSIDRLRGLLPSGPAAVTRSSLRYLGASSAPAFRAGLAVARVAAPARVHHQMFRERVRLIGPRDDEPWALPALFDAPERTELFFAVRAGLHRPNGKPVVQAMSSDGTPMGFAKFGWNDVTRELVAHESVALQRLATQHLSNRLRVPRLIAAGPWGGDGQNHLVIDPLAVPGRSDRDSDVHVAHAMMVAELAPRSESALSSSAYWKRAIQRRDAVMESFGTDERVALTAATHLLHDRWGSHRMAFGMAHGDWIPANMASRSGVLSVWDWERSIDDAPVGMDPVHFLTYQAVRARDRRGRVEGLLAASRSAIRRMSVHGQLAPTLVLHDLVEMITRFGEAAGTGRARVDRRYTRLLNEVVAEIAQRPSSLD